MNISVIPMLYVVIAHNILVFYLPLLPIKVIEKKLIHKFSQRLI